MSKEKQNKALEAQCEKFNAACPIGGEVIVTRDDGSTYHTVTRSNAMVLEGHTPVVWLRGQAGCVHLDRVQPCPEDERQFPLMNGVGGQP